MAKTKISEFSATPANNTDIDSINIAEGCAPSGINDAIRELMAQLKDFQTGAVGDSFNGPVGTSTAAAGAFTTLAASGAVTLSGGTANGVTYLNGSKVLTSGSALTFDGTTIATTGKFGITGNGSIPTASALEIGSNGAGTRFRYNIPTGGEHNFTENGSVISFQNTNAHGWLIAGTEGMRLTSTGLGIGLTSPSAKLHIFSANSVSSRVETSGAGSAASQFKSPSGSTFLGQDATGGYLLTDYAAPILFYTNNAERARITSGGDMEFKNAGGTSVSFIGVSSTAAQFGNRQNDAMILYTNNTERARIDSSGNLLVGASSFADGSNVFRIGGSTISSGSSVTTTRTRLEFNSSGLGTVGSISTNGSATTYSTSSDYRLKNSIAPMTGALAKVALLKPCTYKWNADGSDGEGFIAHELAEVCPQAVVGEKDAVNEDGNPVHQGIDTSFLVATLTSALQELNAKFEAYVASHP
jgi:hypothetical protein